MRLVTAKISVVGTGYLGAVFASCMARLGHDVTALDEDAQKIDELARGRAPFYEPGLTDLIGEGLRNNRLRFTTNWDDLALCDVHFLCVGTPSARSGDAADLSHLRRAAMHLAPRLAATSLVVGRSTVPVGTASWIQTTLSEIVRRPVRLAWNPEFLREGSAIRDTLSPKRLVYGVQGEHSATDVMTLDEIYHQVINTGVARFVTNYSTAELAKVAANAFLAAKISFANGIGELCGISGADVVELADILGSDDRIGRKFLNAGLGFGGGCLPKDVRALRARAQELGANGIAELLANVEAINARQRAEIIRITIAILGGSVRGRTVGILGAAFKPNSDDVRESPALAVAEALQRLGADVRVHDPHALEAARSASPDLTFMYNVIDACAGAHAVLHLTEWEEYQRLDPAVAFGAVANSVIVDARNTLNQERWREAGWTYVGVARRSEPGTMSGGLEVPPVPSLSSV